MPGPDRHSQKRTGHDMKDGDRVIISGVTGLTGMNGTWTVKRVTDTTHEGGLMYHYEKTFIERQSTPHGQISYFIKGPAGWVGREVARLFKEYPEAGYGTRILRDESCGEYRHTARLVEIKRSASCE